MALLSPGIVQAFKFRVILCAACLILLFSCSKDDDEQPLVCNQYFLATEGDNQSTTTVYYNSSGKISALVAQGGFVNNRLELVYDNDNRLIEVLQTPTPRRWRFLYDNAGQLVATASYDESGTRTDSLVIEYDAGGRLRKRSLYQGSAPLSNLSNYFLLEYPDEKTVRADFFNRDQSGQTGYSGTFTYTMDDKKRPYPDEYYLLYLSWSNVVIDHNALSLELSNNGTVTSVDTYEYTYNAGGYPVQRRYHTVATDYVYTCEAQFE